MQLENMAMSNVIGALARYALAALVAAIVLFPLSWVVLGSFKSASELFAYPPSLWPTAFTLENYTGVLSRSGFGGYIVNSIIVATISVVLTVAIGAVAAYGFSRWEFRFKNAILIFMLALQLIPSTVNIIPYYLMMNQLGLLNTLTGLIVIYTASALPFTIWLLKGFFDTLSTSLDEAALIDGCSRFRVFWNIILPLSLPGLAAASFLAFIAAWAEFLVPLVIANARSVAVVSVGLYSFFGEDRVAYNELFAASVMTAGPVVIAYIFAQKYFISGLAAGSEK